MTSLRALGRTALATALLPVAIGTALLTAPPAQAADTGSVLLTDRAHSLASQGGSGLGVELRDYVTYPLAGGRGSVSGHASADVSYGITGSPITLSSYYTVRRVADAAWRGEMRASPAANRNFSVGGLTAYLITQSTATNLSAAISGNLTAFMTVGAAIEHSATASFTPTGGVRMSLTAVDRRTLY